jgi:hypothetical protein
MWTQLAIRRGWIAWCGYRGEGKTFETRARRELSRDHRRGHPGLARRGSSRSAVGGLHVVDGRAARGGKDRSVDVGTGQNSTLPNSPSARRTPAALRANLASHSSSSLAGMQHVPRLPFGRRLTTRTMTNYAESRFFPPNDGSATPAHPVGGGESPVADRNSCCSISVRLSFGLNDVSRPPTPSGPEPQLLSTVASLFPWDA